MTMRSRKKRTTGFREGSVLPQEPQSVHEYSTAPEGLEEAPVEEKGIHLTEPMEATMEPVTEPVEQVASAVAETVEQGATAAAETVAAVSDETVRAMDEAREHLRSMAPPSFGLDASLNPFKTAPDLFKTAMSADAARATQAMADFNSKALTAWRSNAESAFEHWRKLAAAKSFSEAIALNAEFARKQIESITTQSREFTDLAGRLTRDIAKTTEG